MPKQTSVPLLCSLCPNNPTFSDMSHLLTHISSKSHLAHRFKLEIRSQAEPEAKEKLENFELWYKENNLDVLLTERHAIKEEKKVAKERKEFVKTKRATRTNVKKEVKKENNPERDDFASSIASTPQFRRRGPQMVLWPTVTQPRGLQSSSPARFMQPSPKVVYDTPTLRRPVPNFSVQETPHTASLSQQLRTPMQANCKNEEDSEKNSPESAKLKGILWPGMNMFDSATPEMKRMRNQRKDVSVLHNMMATSAGVQALEVSYTADGGFRAARDIYGPTSDVEVTPQKPAPKKRRNSKPAAALRDVNINVPRLRTRNLPRLRAPEAQMTGSSPQKRSRTRQSNASRSSRTGPTTVNPLASMGGKLKPSVEDDEEYRLTFGDVGKKLKLGIFQDEPRAGPARSESPLDDFMGSKFDRTGHNLPASGFNAELSPKEFVNTGNLPKAWPYRFSSKASSMTAASSHVLPSMIFNDPTSNPLYNQALTNSYNFGDRQEGFDTDFKQPLSNLDDYKPIGPFDGLNIPDYRNGLVNPRHSSSNKFGNDDDGDYSYSSQYRL